MSEPANYHILDYTVHCIKSNFFVDVDSYFSILTGRTKGQSPFAKWLEGKEKHLPLYPNAASSKVKIYIRTEVSKAKGLEKRRRNFWKSKAEELCQDRVLSKYGIIIT